MRMRIVFLLAAMLTTVLAVSASAAVKSRVVEYQTRLTEIESAVRSLKVARPFEVDLQRLRIHLHMVQEDLNRIGAVN